jgi:hypothetical protein
VTYNQSSDIAEEFLADAKIFTTWTIKEKFADLCLKLYSHQEDHRSKPVQANSISKILNSKQVWWSGSSGIVLA